MTIKSRWDDFGKPLYKNSVKFFLKKRTKYYTRRRFVGDVFPEQCWLFILLLLFIWTDTHVILLCLCYMWLGYQKTLNSLRVKRVPYNIMLKLLYRDLYPRTKHNEVKPTYSK